MGIVPTEALLEQAKHALGTGAAIEAISLGRQLLRQAPQLAAGYDVLGHAFLATGRADRALIAFEYVLHLDQTNSDGHYGCGLAHLALEQRAAALQSFRAALTSRPERLDIHGYIEQLAPRPAVAALDPSAQSFFAGSDWADLTTSLEGSADRPSSGPVDGLSDLSAQSFFAGIDWDALDLPSDLSPASSVEDDSTMAVEPFDFSDFIPGDLTPFSLDEAELDRAEPRSSSDGHGLSLHTEAHPALVSAALVQPLGEVGAENVLPVSLLDLGLQNDVDQARVPAPSPLSLADLPEAAAAPTGFIWEPPTWMAHPVGGTADQGHASIFAKLVQHQSPQPAADSGLVHPDYFSLDEVELRQAGNAVGTGSSQPELPLTITHIVSSNREYLMANRAGPASGPDNGDSTCVESSATMSTADSNIVAVTVANTGNMTDPIVTSPDVDAGVSPLSLADLILGDSDAGLPAIDVEPFSLVDMGLAAVDPAPLMPAGDATPTSEPVQEQAAAVVPVRRVVASPPSGGTVAMPRDNVVAQPDKHEPKAFDALVRAAGLPQQPQEGVAAAAQLPPVDKLAAHSAEGVATVAQLSPVDKLAAHRENRGSLPYRQQDVETGAQPSAPLAPPASPLAEATMARHDGRFDEALAAYQHMLEEQSLVPLVTAELESMIAGGKQLISARRVRRVLVTAYLKQHRYGAAVAAYLGSIFGG